MKFVQRIHDSAGDAMAYIAPILAPVLSAIAVYAGLVDDFGRIAATAGAFAIEGLGFAAVRLMLRAKEETDSRMLWGSTVVMTVIYLGAVYGILATTHLEAYTMAFPLLTVTGAIAYAVNGELDRRKTAPVDKARQEIDLKAYEKERMAEARAHAKAVSTQVSTPVHGEQFARHLPEKNTRKSVSTPDDLRVYDEQHPGASLAEAAEALGMSRSWVSKWRNR